MSNGYTSNTKSGHDSITVAIALDILREAKGLMDMASKGLPAGQAKTELTCVRRKLWGIIQKVKKGGAANDTD